MAEYQFDTGICSEAGRKAENQDSLGIRFPEGNELAYKGIVIAIADGVSGCCDGKAASEFCINSLSSDYYTTSDSWSVKKSVEQVLLATNRWLFAQGSELQSTLKSMASTLSAIIIKSNTAHLIHIGDSRIYRLRGNQLEQLTQDHSWCNSRQNYLLRAMGIDLNLQLDYKTVVVECGDTFILTSDGVHEYVDLQDLTEDIINSDDLDEVAGSIVNRAYQNQSPDNMSCLITRFNSLPDPSPDEIYQKLTDLPFPPTLKAGMKLDDINILRTIHNSSRCQINLALLSDSNEQVVIKTPSVNYEDDPAFLELFRHEEWVGNRIQSPHVMKILKPANHQRNFLYHIAEYINGQTLQQWMHDNPLPGRHKVRDIAEQIARGLQAFHRMQMLHQDIKPDNIMINQNGTVKLIDFGSVKIAGIEEISTPIQRIELLGTRNYSAPEYFLGYKGSQRSDQFSLAVVIYEMLSGHLPYGEKYGEKSLSRCKYVSIRNYLPDLPIWMDKALQKALSFDPERRYSELSEFIYDLSHPNPAFLQQDKQPLLERNPLAFWKGLAIISLIANLALFIWFQNLGN